VRESEKQHDSCQMQVLDWQSKAAKFNAEKAQVPNKKGRN